MDKRCVSGRTCTSDSHLHEGFRLDMISDEEIVKKYKAGWTFMQLEKLTGKSQTYISNRLKYAGVKPRAQGHQVGLPHTEEAKKKMSLSKMGWTPPPISEESREKRRKSRVGKKPSLGMKHSEETRRKMSESRRGKGNARWIDGRKQTPYPPEWTKALRDDIRSRQNYLCAICEVKKKTGLNVHHIDCNKQNCHSSNLIGLCSTCHGLVHRHKTKESYRRWLVLYARCRDAKMGLPVTDSTNSGPTLVNLFKTRSHTYWQSLSS